ncbi:murein biosynthesis integral membrane protein MurJ [Thermophilibacter provencensis]|uniref:Murein biosynthesis integral membrane protein MurJ n=1 Tax=Thermophilibacter provencensis TaxID=1852386 RepID=A0A921GG78_9ACTN|nr:lipid II flippase MurJ [Thermophilibacter provencensis]HJF45696.1 murein biosynthesis integral membrane protein MurJ [Thermophilibacter provencensis]
MEHETTDTPARGAHFSSDGAPGRPLRPRHAAAPQPASPDDTMIYVAAARAGRVPSRPEPGRPAHAAQGETSAFAPLGRHAARPAAGPESEGGEAEATGILRAGSPGGGEDEVASEEAVGRSAAMMSGLVIISRITGFMRTWAQAIGLGATMTASAFTVANNLPNQLYELVMGGMLVTAFLPVYVSAKKRAGREGATAYASNLLSLVVLLMGVLAVAAFAFAEQVIWTQSFSASEEFDAGLSVYFFRFFAVSIVLYALSSIISGVLNAERDYLWSTAAPIANNVVTTASFLAYGLLVDKNPQLALLTLAVGSPLGVLSQVLMQVPALLRHGVRLRLRIDLHDPCLRETVSIGAPTLIVTLVSFATTSIQTNCALSATASGASIAYYARMWYMLPYSVFAIPITTAMFTELSTSVARDDLPSFVRGLASGTGKILFMLVPFAMYLVVFSPCLARLLGGGSMDAQSVGDLAAYIAWLSVSLPGYGLATYLQKACSALRRMILFAVAECIAGTIQIVLCLWLTPVFGLNFVGFSSTFFFVSIDLVILLFLRRELGRIGMRDMVVAFLRAFSLGAAGAVVGGAILLGLQALVGPLGSGMAQALAYAVAGGVPALVVTFGLAAALRLPEASFVTGMLSRLSRRRAA